jgi:hypothetical protein
MRGNGRLKIDGRRNPPVRWAGCARAACRAESAEAIRALWRVWEIPKEKLRAKTSDQAEGWAVSICRRRAAWAERNKAVWAGLVQPRRLRQSRIHRSRIPVKPRPGNADGKCTSGLIPIFAAASFVAGRVLDKGKRYVARSRCRYSRFVGIVCTGSLKKGTASPGLRGTRA